MIPLVSAVLLSSAKCWTVSAGQGRQRESETRNRADPRDCGHEGAAGSA